MPLTPVAPRIACPLRYMFKSLILNKITPTVEFLRAAVI
jgi:hypothetical protein